MGGRSLLGHAMAVARAIDPEFLVVVVRHERDLVAAHVAQVDPQALIADQDEVKGTGRAVECGLDVLPAGLAGTVVVTYGDVPLLSRQTLEALVREHEEHTNAVTVLVAEVANPAGYGRVLRDERGEVLAIVEHKDADAGQRAIREVNSGIYAFDAAVLRTALAQVGTDNVQGEKYLTDVLALAREAGGHVRAVVTHDALEVEGVNDRVQLATLGGELNRRLVREWMLRGVTVVDPATTWVDVDVELSPDVTILPGVQLLGSTKVSRGARIGPDTTLTDCVIGEDAEVIRAHGSGARLRAGAQAGPFTFLRPGTDLGEGARVGGFCETKNAQIGPGTKVPHLSYVGDATIGAETNIGAATVFVNYDGVAKHRTTVGSHVRIGSDTMLVAPVTIGDGAYTAAGSVIINNVPPGAMAVARGKQRNVEGWVERRRAGTASAQAAQAATSQQQSPDVGTAAGTGTAANEGVAQ